MPAKAATKKASQAGRRGAGAAKRATGELRAGPLTGQLQGLAGSAKQYASASTTAALTGMTERLTEYAAKGGGPGLIHAITGREPDLRKVVRKATGPVVKRAAAAPKQALDAVKDRLPSLGGSDKSDRTKATNIVESVDIGLPVRTVYDVWTQFTEFPTFMRKVENVQQDSDEKLTWKARILWSHRTWESTIIDQVPDKHIVWRSKGAKGHVDGTVSFHELAPDLTRVLLSLEYYPQGLFERVGNIWRAPGRRARLELKHFRRHAMAEVLMNADGQSGWRGEIHDGKVATGRRKAKSKATKTNSKDNNEDAENDDQPTVRRSRKRQR
jgi:uncharacterized membrane protein